jgi:ADP-ribose pyrophosphatase YjhB (NUDIX family)
LPGGGVERNEALDAAISRELHEEISIVPNTICFLITLYPKTHVYYVSLTEEEVATVKIGNEGKDLQFFSLDEMSTISLTQKLRMVFETQKDALKSLLQ